MSKTSRSGALLSTLLAGWLVSCSNGPAPPPLRVGLLVWPGYELFFLARDQGLYPDGEIQLVSFRSPAEAVRAYRAGLLDGVALTLEYAIQIESEDPGQAVVLVIDTSDGGDSLLARKGIDSLADLRGRRIGVEASALGVFFSRRVLEKAGLTESDVHLVPIDVGDQERAFLSGEVDALATFEPTRSRLLAEGAHELFNSRDLPGQILDVLLVPDELVHRRTHALTLLTRGWFAARARLSRDPPAAAAAMAPREKLTPSAFLEALKGLELTSQAENRDLLLGAGPGSPPGLVAVIADRARLLRHYGLIDRPIEPAEMVSGEIAQGLEP
jgi:NitT/TauT family transport system substrate-binding protein